MMNFDGPISREEGYGPGCVMEVNGLTCIFNMPSALQPMFRGGEEVAQELPPYRPRKAFLVDDYPACPSSWPRGSGTEASYLVPVKEGYGIWLDFNRCRQHTHHVGILISIQGINPLTGQKTTDSFRLEEYKENCPVHNTKFGHNRHCEQCGFDWPAQNFLSSAGTPFGKLWLDGFRAPDGVTRQWFLDAREIQGIAAQLIGEQRVYSIGIAFFLSKEPKPAPPPPIVKRSFAPSFPSSKSLGFGSMSKGGGESFGGGNSFGGGGFDVTENFEELPMAHSPAPPPSSPSFNLVAELDDSCGVECCDGVEEIGEICEVAECEFTEPSDDIEEQVTAKKLEVGAGARIDQKVHASTLQITDWQETPVGTIYINYADEAVAEKILSAGKKEKTQNSEGWMKGLNDGSPGGPGAPPKQ
jgi:hypothetical protein